MSTMNGSPRKTQPVTPLQVLSKTSRSKFSETLKTSRIDHHNTTIPPVDLSFQNLDSIAAIQPAFQSKNFPHKTLTGLKICYNDLTSIAGLANMLDSLVPGTRESLVWLDVSYNKLTQVEDEFLLFPNLTFLSIAGNNIQNVAEVRKLNALTSLSKFSFQGNNWQEDSVPSAGAVAVQQQGRRNTNGKVVTTETGGLAYVTKQLVRVESTKNYRTKLLWYLRDTKLKTLDSVTVSHKEKEQAIEWGQSMIRARHKAKSEAT